jgi:hypothetical protein
VTAEKPASPTLGPPQGSSALVLRESRELQQVPPERPPAPVEAPPQPAAPVTSPAETPPVRVDFQPRAGWRRLEGLPRSAIPAPPPELAWALASFALAAGAGWLFERRRRVQLELELDGSVPTTQRRLRSVTPSEPVPSDSMTTSSQMGLAAPSIHVLGIAETTSRREATLVDLHQLLANLKRLRKKGEKASAADLLEAHLVDFRYTSPWVFLELRELYLALERSEEWELAREAFRLRFGQNAPQWSARSTAEAEIADDTQLCQELLRKWPRRDARLFILRWMLGDATSRQKSFGPPQLALGVYRDMMFLDALLDEAMAARADTAGVAA